MSNPFDDNYGSSKPSKRKPSSNNNKKSNNPFDDDGVGGGGSNRSGSSTNPFDDNNVKSSSSSSKKSSKSKKKSTSNNPFDDNDNGISQPKRPSNISNRSKSHDTRSGGGGGGSTNPFDDGGQPPRRSSSKGSLNPFDDDNDDDFVRESKKMAKKKQNIATPLTSSTTSASSKPTKMSHRASTTGTSSTLQRLKEQAQKATTKVTTNIVGSKMNRDGPDGVPLTGSGYNNSNQQQTDNMDGIGTKKCSKFVKWPFDDYHEVQEKYYEKIDSSKKLQQKQQQQVSSSLSDPLFGNDDNDGMGMVDEFFKRPKELPEINKAVKGLSLVDFENKAEERAINQVSTWLYDTGLIDILMDSNTFTQKHNISNTQSIEEEKKIDLNDSDDDDDGNNNNNKNTNDNNNNKNASIQRMDKEIDKFRLSIQRELSIINTRLNDGVAASGSEVQELVTAVTATKGDLSKLRTLATSISNGGALFTEKNSKDKKNKNKNNSDDDIEFNDDLIISNYPHLKNIANAKTNLKKCFRDLEFFSNISKTCNRLRDELHSGEWTDDEWKSIRNVCMEHVELEILLIEAEAGMKARVDIDDTDSSNNGIDNRRNQLIGSQRASYIGKPMKGLNPTSNINQVDKFLEPHVKNVWELGEEIRMRVLSGIGSAFDLSIKDPAGLVALAESIEVYERASEEFHNLHSNDNNSNTTSSSNTKNGLHFTDIRSAALSQLIDDFEMRGINEFKDIQEDIANSMTGDESDEENDIRKKEQMLNRILKKAQNLVHEIDHVKNVMSPCLPPYWGVEAIWSTCVAKVCSQHILQQIGGEDAHNLQNFTTTQLLDLMAWVEYFKITTEESFPKLKEKNSNNQNLNRDKQAIRNYNNNIQDLLSANKKQIDIDTAVDVLIKVSSSLWEVKRLTNDEFIHRTKSQTESLINKIYAAEPNRTQTSEGRLETSLPEDVFSFVNVQLRTIRQRLSNSSETLAMAATLIFQQLRLKQIHERNDLLEDLESCCAAANDFHRMSEQCEELVDEIKDNSNFNEEDGQSIDLTSEELLSVYHRDAVYAASNVHTYVFEPIREAIGSKADSESDELFGTAWEEELTHNECALTLVRTLEDFMGDLEEFIEPTLLRKSVDSLLAASITFYLECLLVKAENHKNNRQSLFISNERALERISGDIRELKSYFDELSQTMPALKRQIINEFDILTSVYELLLIAAGISPSDNATDFIYMLQKKIKDPEITKYFVGDLWHIVNPTEEKTVIDMIDDMDVLVERDDNAIYEAKDSNTVPGLRLDEMIAKLYLQSKRKRPSSKGQQDVTLVVERWK